jgi:hypothetical protein
MLFQIKSQLTPSQENTFPLLCSEDAFRLYVTKSLNTIKTLLGVEHYFATSLLDEFEFLINDMKIEFKHKKDKEDETKYSLEKSKVIVTSIKKHQIFVHKAVFTNNLRTFLHLVEKEPHVLKFILTGELKKSIHK